MSTANLTGHRHERRAAAAVAARRAVLAVTDDLDTPTRTGRLTEPRKARRETRRILRNTSPTEGMI
jgi:hypothetical protein